MLFSSVFLFSTWFHFCVSYRNLLLMHSPSAQPFCLGSVWSGWQFNALFQGRLARKYLYHKFLFHIPDTIFGGLLVFWHHNADQPLKKNSWLFISLWRPESFKNQLFFSNIIWSTHFTSTQILIRYWKLYSVCDKTNFSLKHFTLRQSVEISHCWIHWKMSLFSIKRQRILLALLPNLSSWIPCYKEIVSVDFGQCLFNHCAWPKQRTLFFWLVKNVACIVSAADYPIQRECLLLGQSVKNAQAS